MTSFRLVNYGPDARQARAGLLVDDRIIDLDAALASRNAGISGASTLAVLEAWDEALPVLDQIAAAGPDDSATPLADAHLLAPLLYPGAIYCAAANYTDHYNEMTMLGGKPDKNVLSPYFFLKSPRHTVVGPGDAIRLPPRSMSTKIDWEVEIGAVIGRPAHQVSQADAMNHVAGYTIVNDVSARDHMKREDWPFFSSDWFNQKVFDTSAPTGPWITPARDIADPHDLSLKTWVNDELMQNSSSRYMVFDIAEQIESLSRQITLLPGDIIATGTCSGVGGARDIYLKPGDHVRMTIEGLGTLENPVVGPAER
jgi:2-keto-4-pentenoate hydratase/2-oxohepta-3-ene-1,7-dioic acid hydratase in catechol pathway